MPVTENWPSSLPGPQDDDYQWEEAPRVKIAQFGDGYEQRAVDGINARPRTFSLSWPALDATDKDTARNFLVARNGWEAFNWTPPGEGSSIKVKCPRWTVQRRSGPWWYISVTFIEVFDQ